MAILVTFIVSLPLVVLARKLWLRIGNRNASKASRKPSHAEYLHVLTGFERFNREAIGASQTEVKYRHHRWHPYGIGFKLFGEK
jgi:hypothetical protein